jgi:hypothetical protein
MSGNRDRFDSLQDQYGSKENIPNDILYSFLLEIKQDLVNLSKLGSDTVPTSSLGKEVRRRCVFDIRWLAHYFLWDAIPASDGGILPIEKNIFLDPQYDSIWDLYVKKDPAVSIEKLSPVKTRVLLWPRGGAKSFSDHVDTYQWVIAYPSIRILYLTAEASLSVGFMSEVKAMFTIREDDPSFSNLFFPEHCSLAKDMRKGNLYTTPVYKSKKTGRKEPTIVASSVGKTKSGWHYEVIKADDAVSDKNSETETQCLSVSEKLDLVENLLIPGGGGFYIQFIGTRYHEVDHYGKLTDKFKTKGEVLVLRQGRGWQFLHNQTFNVDILIGKCCQIKQEVAEKLAREGRPVTYSEAGEDGCILLLPNLMSYSFFMSKFTKNERVTEGQLNQNPQAASDVEFNRAFMVRSVVPFQRLPRQGPCCQFWDFAFSQKKGRDYSTGASIIWSEEDELKPDGTKTGNRKTVGYVRKIIRGRFNHSALAQAIVDLAEQEQPWIIGIEKAAGSELLEPTIISTALRTQNPRVIEVCSHIDWVPTDNQVDAKRVRMRSMHPWIAEGRLKFLNACMAPDDPQLEAFYSEWEKCLVSHHHDDIPDVISQMPNRYAPKATQVIVENRTEMFSNVDRQGWYDIYDPNYRPNLGQAYFMGDDGVISPHQQMSPSRFLLGDDGMFQSLDSPSPLMSSMTDFLPEPDLPSASPGGMPNILGAGLWG